MHVIIMRHGQAAYAGTDRVLTATGRAEAAATGLKLGGLFTIHHVFASPKTRALETARLVLEQLPGVPPQLEEVRELTPSGNAALVHDLVLSRAQNHENVLLVSHIPLVELLTEEFCPGIEMPIFGTAAALVIDYDENMHGRVVKFITPSLEVTF